MKKPHILIVEADTAAQRQYRAALAKLDSPELCFVPSVQAAEQTLRSRSVDLLIAGVDSNPAELELLRTARQLDAELPMIVVTAKPDVASATASLRLGAGDYLTKPVDADVLAATRRAAVGRTTTRSRVRTAATPGRAALSLRRHDRRLPGHAEGVRHDRPGGQLRRRCAGGRRDGHRQGVGRAQHSQPQPPGARAVRAGRLRRDPRKSAGKRILRPRERLVHRRRQQAASA